MGTPQIGRFCETTFAWGKFCIADFAHHLSFGTIVTVKVIVWSSATRADRVLRNTTGRTAAYRFDFLVVSFFVVRNQVFVSPLLFEVSNQREFINFEFLIFGRVRIVKSPLLKRKVSTNKI